ncbi:MAG: hypothetical protein ACREQQ_09880 [Candidatus Binatia bacterium]
MNLLLLARNAPVVALSLDLVPRSIRGLAGGTMLVATTIIGTGFGPLLVGLVSDSLSGRLGDAEALRISWVVTAASTLLAGAAIGLVPLRTVAAGQPVTGHG